ncbi:MAG: 1-acyl-sn-glycerol-3-phosphate acyltransferase [Acidimicrobiales bacterium]
MEHLLRRLRTVPSALTFGIVMSVTFPVWLPLVVVFDLLTVGRRLPAARLMVFTTYFALCEMFAIVTAIGLWVVSGFGRLRLRSAYVWIQATWLWWLMLGARALLGVRVEGTGPLPLPSGNVVVLSRHTSLADTVLPGHLLLKLSSRSAHYVLKRELQWLPSLDLYGHRLGNLFVVRGGNTEHELQLINDLGVQAAPDAGLVIFPEGTFNTVAKRAQVVASLRSSGRDDLADYAASLRHLLPPKPAGTLALLDSQPTADVVVLGHIGLDGLSEPGALRAMLPLSEPVRLQWWTHSRQEVDNYPGGPEAWLRDRWVELDEWIAAGLAETNPPRH